MKRNDPYAQLGLTWGATTAEIKEAYKQKARQHHPDLNPNCSKSLRKFQAIQSAFQKLMKSRDATRDDLLEEWSFQVWRNGDVIAQERTDVAGVKRKRPAKPAAASMKKGTWGVAALGHPSGGGVKLKRGEYLGDGSSKGTSSTVGTGRNKWVTPRELKPWKPQEGDMKRASLSKPATTKTTTTTTTKGET